MKPMLVVGFYCEMFGFCVFFCCCVAGLQTTLASKEEKKKRRKEEDPRVDEAENKSGILNFDALFVACVSLFVFAGGLEITTGEGRKESHHC